MGLDYITCKPYGTNALSQEDAPLQLKSFDASSSSEKVFGWKTYKEIKDMPAYVLVNRLNYWRRTITVEFQVIDKIVVDHAETFDTPDIKPANYKNTITNLLKDITM